MTSGTSVERFGSASESNYCWHSKISLIAGPIQLRQFGKRREMKELYTEGMGMRNEYKKEEQGREN